MYVVYVACSKALKNKIVATCSVIILMCHETMLVCNVILVM
jgi:hypothetical protein